MFIDSAKIHVKAGNGGNGCISFRREKFVPAGGPDGGDGGAGGDVILLGDSGLHTLSDFRYKRKYAALNGAPGSSSNRTGKSGDDLVIKTPLGTLAYDASSGRLIADITVDGQAVIIAHGGKGGAGNQHFATPTRQIPNFAKSGTEGEETDVDIELKVLADVGLVGFPNVGKSTLLSVVSSAKPKIADYHFTTLSPNLGVVDVGEAGDVASYVMADIPGLIEGAHTGAGLGDEFLKHIERTRLLLHVVDIAGTEGRDPVEDYHAINAELKNYRVDLSSKPQIIAANKSDALPVFAPGEGTAGGIAQDGAASSGIAKDGAAPGGDSFQALKEAADETGFPVYLISAATGRGVRELISAVWEKLCEIREEEKSANACAGISAGAGIGAGIKIAEPSVIIGKSGVVTNMSSTEVLYTIEKREPRFIIDIIDDIYVLTGQWLKKLVDDTNFGDNESVQYFQTMLKKYGIIDALEERGIIEGATVKIYDIEFDYIR